jgi:hypothetical protein
MNTKLIMTASALFLAVLGISLTFLPREIADQTGICSAKSFQLVLQITGALYFSFAMVNWMAKGAIIGGIYNKPIAIGNFTHFFIGALALIKAAANTSNLPAGVYLLTGPYAVFALLFGLVAFRDPNRQKQPDFK